MFSLLCTFSFTTYAQDEDVMFQAFDWNVQDQPAGRTWYNVVADARSAIVGAGIDVLWMPPPSNSAAPQGYLPRELYDFNSAYGTEQQLRDLISAYHDDGLKVLSDVVINHRVGSQDAVNFTNPAWPTTFITADDEGRSFVDFPVEFSRNGDFVPGRDLKADGSNGTFAAARDLDHENPAVREEIIAWMNFLRNDLGFDGWRYDFVHGYNPIYNKTYNDATSPYFAVGELLESSRVQTNNFVNATQQSSSAFDFNTKVSLQNAVRNNDFSGLRDGAGNPSGMIGVNPSKSVTFLDNHDTGLAQQCCGSNYVFPSDQASLRKGYAYILTHPGNPMVFWTHLFGGGAVVRSAIEELIAIRKSVRVFSGSPITIDQSRSDLYAAYVEGRGGTLAMKLGPGDWTPNGEDWALRTSGSDYAVWSTGGNANPPPPPNPPNPDTSFKVYARGFRTIYTWDDDGQATSGAWPGTATVTQGAWQTARVPGECSNVIFSDNGSAQTADLETCSDKPYYYEGQWFATDPLRDPPTDDLTVYVRDYTSIYTWSEGTATSGAWPGAELEATGDGWYRYTLADTECSNVIFSNGGRDQTADLYTCRDEPYYYNNRWNAAPSVNQLDSRSATDEISIAPNPIQASSEIRIVTRGAERATVTLSNLLGQSETIFTGTLTRGTHSIPLRDTDVLSSSGTYLVRVSIDGRSTTSKVVKN